MEKCRLQRDVAQRRGSKLIAIGRQAGILLQAEIFVGVQTIEDRIAFAYAEIRRNLGHSDDVVIEVAEHFVGLAADRVAPYTFPFAEENERALLLSVRHGSRLTSGEVVYRRVRENQGELKLGNRLRKH